MPVKRAKSEECAADEAYKVAAARRRETAARAEHTQRSSENPERQARATKALIREADEQMPKRQDTTGGTEQSDAASLVPATTPCCAADRAAQ